MREIYIRKMEYDAAKSKLKRELDELYLAGEYKIKIVHGKGKGILREMVAEYLTKQPFVKSFYSAPLYYGGSGVTIVEFDI